MTQTLPQQVIAQTLLQKALRKTPLDEVGRQVEGDVLVLGSSPHGPLSRVFLGSTATKILQHSPVPVILIPAGKGVAVPTVRSAS